MQTKFFTKTIHTWIICIIVLVSACQKETSESPLEGLVPVHDTTTMVASEGGTIDTAGGSVLMPRAGLNVDKKISLSGFKYVGQNDLPKYWKTLSRYSFTGACEYPQYTGTIIMTKTSYTNLCGIASFLMALSLVPHDALVGVPSIDSLRVRRLAQCARRYKQFDSQYEMGDDTYLNIIANMANGTSSLKGEFSHWGNCSEKQWVGSEFKSYAPNSSGRNLMKTFIRTHILNDYPVIAIISINSSKGNAKNPGYITTSGGAGHMVVIVGVKEIDSTGVYRVYFKDPLTNSSETYDVDYTLFLDSMIDAPTNYNALAIVGQ